MRLPFPLVLLTLHWGCCLPLAFGAEQQTPPHEAIPDPSTEELQQKLNSAIPAFETLLYDIVGKSCGGRLLDSDTVKLSVPCLEGLLSRVQKVARDTNLRGCDVNQKLCLQRADIEAMDFAEGNLPPEVVTAFDQKVVLSWGRNVRLQRRANTLFCSMLFRLLSRIALLLGADSARELMAVYKHMSLTVHYQVERNSKIKFSLVPAIKEFFASSGSLQSVFMNRNCVEDVSDSRDYSDSLHLPIAGCKAQRDNFLFALTLSRVELTPIKVLSLVRSLAETGELVTSEIEDQYKTVRQFFAQFGENTPIRNCLTGRFALNWVDRLLQDKEKAAFATERMEEVAVQFVETKELLLQKYEECRALEDHDQIMGELRFKGQFVHFENAIGMDWNTLCGFASTIASNYAKLALGMEKDKQKFAEGLVQLVSTIPEEYSARQQLAELLPKIGRSIVVRDLWELFLHLDIELAFAEFAKKIAVDAFQERLHSQKSKLIALRMKLDEETRPKVEHYLAVQKGPDQELVELLAKMEGLRTSINEFLNNGDTFAELDKIQRKMGDVQNAKTLLTIPLNRQAAKKSSAKSKAEPFVNGIMAKNKRVADKMKQVYEAYSFNTFVGSFKLGLNDLLEEIAEKTKKRT